MLMPNTKCPLNNTFNLTTNDANFNTPKPDQLPIKSQHHHQLLNQSTSHQNIVLHDHISHPLHNALESTRTECSCIIRWPKRACDRRTGWTREQLVTSHFRLRIWKIANQVVQKWYCPSLWKIANQIVQKWDCLRIWKIEDQSVQKWCCMRIWKIANQVVQKWHCLRIWKIQAK